MIDVHAPETRKAIADSNFKSRGFLSALKRIWDLKPEEGALREAAPLFDNWTGDRDDLALNAGSYFLSGIPGMTKELWEKLERDAVRKGIFSKRGSMNIREHIKEEGRQNKEKEVILNMFKEKLDTSLIAKVTGLPKAEIIKLKNGRAEQAAA